MLSKIIKPNAVIISQSNVTEESITLTGGFADSASNYRGYSVEYHDQALYVKIKGNILPFPNSSGNFNINFENKYSNVNKIYIQGSEESDRNLIWEKP